MAAGELWVTDMDSGQSERPLPGVSMTAFEISHDGKKVVYCASDAQGQSYVWIASLQRRFSPRRLAQTENDRCFSAPKEKLFFIAPKPGINLFSA